MCDTSAVILRPLLTNHPLASNYTATAASTIFTISHWGTMDSNGNADENLIISANVMGEFVLGSLIGSGKGSAVATTATELMGSASYQFLKGTGQWSNVTAAGAAVSIVSSGAASYNLMLMGY